MLEKHQPFVADLQPDIEDGLVTLILCPMGLECSITPDLIFSGIIQAVGLKEYSPGQRPISAN
jgi:hypothetical protein